MKIKTARFGDMEILDEDIISLPEGVLGFSGASRFVLLEHDSEGTPFKWLQAVDDAGLAFIVMDPHIVIDGYTVEFSEEMLDLLGEGTFVAEDFALMAIVNIPRQKPIEMTVNLRAPIIVHLEKRLGWQVILTNEDYPIRHRLFPDDEDGAGGQRASKIQPS